ncbi:MAG TPA: NHL repeat-containing protein, partial [Herpetosiphonaceae bacterium]
LPAQPPAPPRPPIRFREEDQPLRAAPAFLLPGVPAVEGMQRMVSRRIPDTAAGLAGRTADGQVELRVVELGREATAARLGDTRAALQEFYRTALPELGWEPLADYPGGAFYRGRAADGTARILSVAFDWHHDKLELLQFAPKGEFVPPSHAYEAITPLIPSEEHAFAALAVGQSGEIYATAPWDFQIWRLGPDGTRLAAWGGQGSGPGQFGGKSDPMMYMASGGPTDIALGPDGAVYVGDLYNGRIQKFSPDGEFLAQIGEPGAGPGQLDPEDSWYSNGLAVAGDGTIYASHGDYVSRFAADGSFLNRWQPQAPRGVDRAIASDLAVGGDGTLYVLIGYEGVVQRYAADGRFLDEWGANGLNPGRFRRARSLAAADDRLYVLDSEPGLLHILAPDGAALGTVSGGVEGDDRRELKGSALAVAPDGGLLAIDEAVILRFAPAKIRPLSADYAPTADAPLPDPAGMEFLPALPTAAEWRELGRRWLRQDPCAAPCWEGVTPGETTVGEALETLKRSPLIAAESIEPTETSYDDSSPRFAISWSLADNGDRASDANQAIFGSSPDDPPPPEMGADGMITVSGGMDLDPAALALPIDRIDIDLSQYNENLNFYDHEIDMFTLGDLIAAYGEPSHVLALPGDDTSWRTLVVLFEDDGIIASPKLFDPAAFGPDLVINQVSFAADSYEAAFGWHSSNLPQPWQGMRDFAFYCRVEQTGAACP